MDPLVKVPSEFAGIRVARSAGRAERDLALELPKHQAASPTEGTWNKTHREEAQSKRGTFVWVPEVPGQFAELFEGFLKLLLGFLFEPLRSRVGLRSF